MADIDCEMAFRQARHSLGRLWETTVYIVERADRIVRKLEAGNPAVMHRCADGV